MCSIRLCDAHNPVGVRYAKDVWRDGKRWPAGSVQVGCVKKVADKICQLRKESSVFDCAIRAKAAFGFDRVLNQWWYGPCFGHWCWRLSTKQAHAPLG